MRMKQRIWQMGLVALATLTLVACGGGSDGSGQATAAAASMSKAQSAKSTSSGQIDASETAVKAAQSTFIVRMSEEPATAYKGGIAGYAATKPNKGQKIDPDSGAVT